MGQIIEMDNLEYTWDHWPAIHSGGQGCMLHDSCILGLCPLQKWLNTCEKNCELIYLVENVAAKFNVRRFLKF